MCTCTNRQNTLIKKAHDNSVLLLDCYNLSQVALNVPVFGDTSHNRGNCFVNLNVPSDIMQWIIPETAVLPGIQCAGSDDSPISQRTIAPILDIHYWLTSIKLNLKKNWTLKWVAWVTDVLMQNVTLTFKLWSIIKHLAGALSLWLRIMAFTNTNVPSW